MKRSGTDKPHSKRILLVDDHPLVRFGFAQAIKPEPDLMVCGEAESAEQALADLPALRPDVIVLDLALPGMGGMELLRCIKRQQPNLAVLVVSAGDEMVYGERVLAAGALGYLKKDEAVKTIVEAIRRVLAGNIYVSSALQAKLLSQTLLSGGGQIGKGIETLTAKELEVLRLLGQWKKEGEIRRLLNIGGGTLYYYRTQLKKKLGLRTGSDLTRYATDWLKGQPI